VNEPINKQHPTDKQSGEEKEGNNNNNNNGT
jgi:hypothetical protein